MNIFFLHTNPRIAAKHHCDKHVPKMIVETGQMLCSALHRTEKIPATDIPYKVAYKNHPTTVWVGDSKANFNWTLELGFNLCMEFTRRFKKLHKTELVLTRIEELVNRYDILTGDAKDGITYPHLAMPEDCKEYSDNYVECYRAYYIRYKRWFADWDRGTPMPKWFTNSFSKHVLLAMKYPMKKVESSNIAELGYIESTSTMRVKFNSEVIYDYNPVSLEEYTSILNAESVGKAFTQFKNREGLKYDRITE